MDDKRIAEIRAREQAATPGPWRIWITSIGPDSTMLFVRSIDNRPISRQDDFEFLSCARQDIPNLLAALEAEREKWNSLVVEIRDLARTDLPVEGYTDEDWANYRLRRIAGMANRAVEGA